MCGDRPRHLDRDLKKLVPVWIYLAGGWAGAAGIAMIRSLPHAAADRMKGLKPDLTARSLTLTGPAVRFGWLMGLLVLGLVLIPSGLLAHTVAQGDQGYIQEITGIHLVPFAYLGAKHMVTGYDHILFLFGVIFFLYGLKHIALYVSLFALGHSTTMLLGVYFNFGINSFLIDAIIGLSIVYKSLDNIGAYQRWFGFSPIRSLRH